MQGQTTYSALIKKAHFAKSTKVDSWHKPSRKLFAIDPGLLPADTSTAPPPPPPPPRGSSSSHGIAHAKIVFSTPGQSIQLHKPSLHGCVESIPLLLVHSCQWPPLPLAPPLFFSTPACCTLKALIDQHFPPDSTGFALPNSRHTHLTSCNQSKQKQPCYSNQDPNLQLLSRLPGSSSSTEVQICLREMHCLVICLRARAVSVKKPKQQGISFLVYSSSSIAGANLLGATAADGCIASNSNQQHIINYACTPSIHHPAVKEMKSKEATFSAASCYAKTVLTPPQHVAPIPTHLCPHPLLAPSKPGQS